MDEEMQNFIRNAKRLGLCAEYTGRWEECRSKKQLVDVALDANGLPYMAESIAKGWGISAEYIAREFAQFNNGQYVRKDGYSSAMYVLPTDDEIHINTTAALIAGFNGSISVDRRMCELYIADSNVNIATNGAYVRVYLYNSTLSDSPGVEVVDDKHYGRLRS